MIKIEEGRLSASDLEHPDLQPLLLPLEAFHGEGSRLPGAVVKNPGGGKQRHWATCWVVNRGAKYVAASGEVRQLSPPSLTTAPAHHRSPPPLLATPLPLHSPAGAAAGGRGALGRTRRGGRRLDYTQGVPRLGAIAHADLWACMECCTFLARGGVRLCCGEGLLGCCAPCEPVTSRARAACTYARHACAPADLPAHLSLGSFARRSPPGQKEWW